jgi:Rod binding domain-containing protein
MPERSIFHEVSSTAEKANIPLEHQKLRKATREFEAYFVGILLKKMHASAAKGGLFDQRSEAATYREMFDEAVAAEIGRSGTFGIGDMLYKEFVKKEDTQR